MDDSSKTKSQPKGGKDVAVWGHYHSKELIERLSKGFNELIFDLNELLQVEKVFYSPNSPLADWLKIRKGEKLFKLFNEDEYSQLLDAIEEAIFSHKLIKKEIKLTRGEESRLIRFKVVFIEIHRERMVTFFAKDITRVVEKQLEQAKLISINEKLQKKILKNLEKNEQIQRTLLEAIPDTIIRLNTEGKILETLNGHHLPYLFVCTEFKPKHIQDLCLSELHKKQLLQNISILISSPDKELGAELHQINSHRFIDVRLVKLNHEEIMGIFRDITANKQAELETRAQKNLLEEVIRTAPSLIALNDEQGRYLVASQSLQNLMGLKKEELIGKTNEELSPFVSGPGKAWLSRTLPMSGKPHKEEVALTLEDGQELWYEVIYRPITNYSGQHQLLRIASNITDRKNAMRTLMVKNIELSEANQLLEKTNEELDRFVYSASHNLRAPLTSLLGLINLQRLEGGHTEYLNHMENAIRRLDGFITDIISYSKNARQELDSEPIEFRPLIDQIFSDLSFYVGRENISCTVEVEAHGVFFSDRKRLEMLLINLISNSYKYHDIHKPTPYIKVEVVHSQEEALILIKDNGLGIAAEHQDNIFKMFYRATERSEGSGLGLYIVKEITQKLGGHIQVESTLGLGTQFTLQLPSLLMKSREMDAVSEQSPDELL
jgi:PAS domain S-box-containing protein